MLASRWDPRIRFLGDRFVLVKEMISHAVGNHGLEAKTQRPFLRLLRADLVEGFIT